jgi:hypothetical protein
VPLVAAAGTVAVLGVLVGLEHLKSAEPRGT